MTRVDFYILPGTAPQGRELLSCRLAEKAYKKGHSVYLHSESKPQAARIDELLWTFRAGSFVPHTLDPAAGESRPPVVIGHGDDPAEADVLINLASTVPLFFSRFERVAEIVDQDDANRSSGRERYRFYRDRGYPLQSHKID